MSTIAQVKSELENYLEGFVRFVGRKPTDEEVLKVVEAISAKRVTEKLEFFLRGLKQEELALLREDLMARQAPDPLLPGFVPEDKSNPKTAVRVVEVRPAKMWSGKAK